MRRRCFAWVSAARRAKKNPQTQAEAWAMFLRPFGPLEMSKLQGPLGRKTNAKHIP